MQKRLLIMLLALVSILTIGCSIHPIRMVMVKSKSVEGKVGIHLIDVNDPNNEHNSIKVIRRADGGRHFKWAMDSDIKQKNSCRVKYHWLYYPINRHMVVEGRLGNSGKYPIILDTGGSIAAILVHDVHVIKNKLLIYPFGFNKSSLLGGFCRLPKLQLGNITFVNFPGLYQQKHVEVQIFGLPIARDESMIIGLPILKKFKYVVFDSVKKEVEFSLNSVFEPRETNLWKQYSFLMKEGLEGNTELFVKIPIAGKNMELKLDTGAGGGLAISENLWEEIRKRLQDVKLRNGTTLYPYYGRLVCKKGIIPKLKIGDNILEKAEVSIFPNDSKLMSHGNQQGLLGMQYFQSTVMVLDFERQLMWVNDQEVEGK